MEILLYCLIYLSYSCAVVVLVLYCVIFALKRSNVERSHKVSSAQMKLLKQSFVVFVLFAASIAAVIAAPYVSPKDLMGFDLAYTENLLNLSIAAVYPICFMAMSGEMR
ncbi:hypothetical protein PENTCL1PPCAC_20288, partial [Pristionchus entomophagus]